MLLLGLAACSSSGHEPSKHASPTAASPSGSAQQGGDLVDPSIYGQSVSGAKTLLNIRGKGDSSPSVPGAGKSGDLVIAVSCSGKGSLKVADKSGRLLLGIATCEGSPGAIYNSRGSFRPDDSALKLTTDAAVAWRIAALQAPHA
ncbi:hypothetical protein [Streptomyces camelliae]|uniref:Lipoprotein n=1 Tax=Streptomyces camelliae TaxID=3004093 RepID=A0ABY7P3L9_9ACTN|nr:hypothetical protein [Streptomyces sp. HUAS 2-6]WBO64114.1 hypothetical protein O1G22_15380 [Streptomyces sp. HUAS 2-6]